MNPVTLDSDRAMSVLGVSGRLTHRTVKPGTAAGLFTNQKWISECRKIKGYGTGAEIQAEIRYDDLCGNGHNSFAITASVYTPASRRRCDIEAGGCLHKDIARVFPELAPLIKWHLFDSTGPMHYVANTLYHASDRDHNGLQAGEQRQIRNGRTGLPCWILETVGDAPRHVDSETQPAAPVSHYVPWMRTGEDKARNLDAARSCAVWPEATDDQLCAPRAELEVALIARLPALLEAFRAAIIGAGLALTPEDVLAMEAQ